MHTISNLFSLDHYFRVLSGIQRSGTFFKIFILALFITIPTSYQLITFALPYTKELPERLYTMIDTLYPDDLIVTIENGRASTNVTEPYYVTLTKRQLAEVLPSFSKESDARSAYRILAIDTKGSAEDFERYQSMMLLTETSLVYYNDDSIQITPLREVSDMQISKQIFIDLVGKIESDQIHTFIIWGIIALPLLIFLLALAGTAYWIFFLAYLVYVVARINHVGVKFRILYRYTMAVAFFPLIVKGLIVYIPGYMDLFGSIHGPIFTVVILALCYIGIKRYALEHKDDAKRSEDKTSAMPPEHGLTFNMDIKGDLEQMSSKAIKQ